MQIIDEMTRNPASYDPLAGFAPSLRNPILFWNDDGRPWTLGMALSMWEFIFARSRKEVCCRDALPF
jgi:hypothetical protein